MNFFMTSCRGGPHWQWASPRVDQDENMDFKLMWCYAQSSEQVGMMRRGVSHVAKEIQRRRGTNVDTRGD